jgi:Bacterial Ig-like domain (group 3)/FG-GAP-like repeat
VFKSTDSVAEDAMSCRFVASICFFTILLSQFVSGQSSRAPLPNQSNRPRIAQTSQQQGTSSLSEKLQRTAPRRLMPLTGLNFAAVVDYGSSVLGGTAVATADVNGDGMPDLIVLGGCADGSGGCVGVLLGNGDGTFQAGVAYQSGGSDPASVGVADINGDGKSDLVVANACTSSSNCNDGTVGLLVGNGDGSFQTAVASSLLGQSADSVTVADVNGDGKLDLIVGTQCTGGVPGCSSGTIAILLGNGDGTFGTVVTYSTGGSYLGGSWVVGPSSVAVVDVNGDGNADVVVASKCETSPVCNPVGYSGAVSVLLGNGDGSFQAAVVYSSGAENATSVVAGDLNDDGKIDLVVSNFCSNVTVDYCYQDGVVGVLLNKGDGTFQNVVTYDFGGHPVSSVTLADVNADGKPDVVAVGTCAEGPPFCNNGTGIAAVMLGNGDGTLNGSVLYDSGGNAPSSVLASDVNRDGSPDLVVASCGSDANCLAEGTVGVLLNTNTGTASSTTLTPLSASKVSFGTNITFTANVESPAGPPPDGATVTFKNAAANVALGTGPLSKGTAIFTSSTISAGSYSVIASYPGGPSFWSSISSPPQVLNVQDFKLGASPATVTVSPGQSGSTTITVTTFGNLNAQTLTKWNCSGLPSASSCSFGSVNTKNQISLKINTTAAADLHRPLFQHHGQLFYALLLPGFLGMVSATRRRPRVHAKRALAWIVLLCLPGFWVACGGGSSGGDGGHGGTPMGSSTVTINANSGSLEHSTTITLNVQ